ncbi:response regulator [Magnetospira sp. QH-2]|uniref:response regulator n=1 Tax=Magnetospira sp. (strain QH-2) TaxID=1288970 RepID=UPI0003E80CDE|nr:response regulator [Magnetospira sp. QH-2]CCQ74627.1 putative Chemotaxis protein CheYIII [Magnetospira sp. QH-2]
MESLNLQNVTFLLVEDNRFSARLAVSILKNLKVARVEVVPSAEDAITLLRSGFQPDILLVDWLLPNMNGSDFTKQVRTRGITANAYIPIIMITSWSRIAVIEGARDSGINEILAKPVSPLSLYNAVVKVIMKPRPFVRSATYFGPNRRRSNDPKRTGPDRRMTIE